MQRNSSEAHQQRSEQVDELIEAIEANGCEVELPDGEYFMTGNGSNGYLIGFRKGNIENMSLVKVQPEHLESERFAKVRCFISTRGQPFGFFEAVRDSELYISDCYQNPSKHIEAEISGDGSEADIDILDCTLQVMLNFDSESDTEN